MRYAGGSSSLYSLGRQIDAGSLLQDLYYKSDSSTREELEKERGSADEVTIRGTSVLRGREEVDSIQLF